MGEIEKFTAVFVARMKELGEAKAESFKEECRKHTISDRDVEILGQCWLDGFYDGCKIGWSEGLSAIQRFAQETN
jgi:hypothetical protein